VRFAALNERVQLFFREWLVLAQVEASDAFIRYNFSFLRSLHKGLGAGLSDTELDARIAINVRFIEQLTGQLVSTVIEELARRSGDAAAQSQVQFWQADPLLMELVEIYHQENKVNPIMNSSWITLGQQLQKLQEVTR
jgi:hypothetical protein